MPDYVLIYRSGDNKMPENPEEGARHMAKWKAWVGDLGDAMVSNTPLGTSKFLTADGITEDGGPDPLLGFSVIKASSMEAALEIARECPYLEVGTIEFAEAKKMEM